MQSSGYPSNGLAANVSKDTTSKELLEVEGKEKDLFRIKNLNLMFGKVNNMDYCNSMLDMPTLFELEDYYKNLKEK
ncbi:hypothetical protein ACVWU4_000976 [Campylobacter coli]